MKRIDKSTSLELAALLTAASDAADELDTAINKYNDAITPFADEVREALTSYNNARADLVARYQELGSDARDYYDERTERWQDGENGQQYLRWVEAFEEFDIDEATLDLPENGLELPNEVPAFDSLELPADDPNDQ